MKQVAGRLRLDLAQYRELEAFAKFGSDLDKATQQQLRRGQRLMEILKQGQYSPMAIEEQVVVIFAATNGFLDEIPVDSIGQFETEVIDYIKVKSPKLLPEIAEKKELTDEINKTLENNLQEFLKTFKQKEN